MTPTEDFPDLEQPHSHLSHSLSYCVCFRALMVSRKDLVFILLIFFVDLLTLEYWLTGIKTYRPSF